MVHFKHQKRRPGPLGNQAAAVYQRVQSGHSPAGGISSAEKESVMDALEEPRKCELDTLGFGGYQGLLHSVA